MITLDLTIRPGGLYSGCHIVTKGSKNFLATREDAAAVIVYGNVNNWLSAQSPGEKELEIIGITPNGIMLSVYELIRNRFDWVFLTNNRVKMFPIKRPEPPEDFRR